MNAVAGSIRMPAVWRPALPLLLVLAAVLIAYRDTVAAMVTIWARSGTFAHAFLVPPIVLWLVWEKRETLARVRPQPCVWMLLPMAGLGLMWLLGDLASVNSVTQLAMTALLVLAVPALLGTRVARIIAFPLAFLFFAVPIGEFLLPQLMDWTADFTAMALRVSGIPVFREGNRLVIPSGTWSVVEACSGVRYLIASLMVGTLFAYLNYRSPWRRWIFVGVSILVPIVANWVRAYLIVLLGHASDNRLAVGADHLIYGWVFFGVVVGLMFAIGSSWKEPAMAAPPPRDGADKPAFAGIGPVAAFWATGLAAFIVVLAPQLALRAMGERVAGTSPHLTAPSRLAGSWEPTRRIVSSWTPAMQNPSAEMTSTYTSAGRDVGVYLAYYRQQDYDRKLVSSENQVVKADDPVWVSIGRSGTETLDIDGQAMTVRSALLRGSGTSGTPEQRLRVWQIYWVGDQLTSSDYRAKFLAAIDRLRGQSDDAALITLYSEEVQPGSAREPLESFVRANLAAIVEQLRVTRDGVQRGGAVDPSRVKARSAGL